MCSKNDLEEHLFAFLKPTRQNHNFLNDSDQAWLNERDIHVVLPFPNLPVEESINGKIKYDNFYDIVQNSLVVVKFLHFLQIE